MPEQRCDIAEHHLLLCDCGLQQNSSAMRARTHANKLWKIHSARPWTLNDSAVQIHAVQITSRQIPASDRDEWLRMSESDPASARISPHLYWQNHLRRGRVLCFQRDLQVEDVVNNVLQDLHLADRLVLRDARNQLLQLGVAVVHVAQGAHRLIQTGVFIPADGEVLLRNAAHGLVAAPHRADGTDGFHGENAGETRAIHSACKISCWGLFDQCPEQLQCSDSGVHFGFYKAHACRRPLSRDWPM